MNYNERYYHNRNELERILENYRYYSQCKYSGINMNISKLLNSFVYKVEVEKQIINRKKEVKDIILNIHLSNIGNSNNKLDQHVNQITNTKANIYVIKELLSEIEMLKEDLEREFKIKNIPDKR